MFEYVNMQGLYKSELKLFTVLQTNYFSLERSWVYNPNTKKIVQLIRAISIQGNLSIASTSGLLISP